MQRLTAKLSLEFRVMICNAFKRETEKLWSESVRNDPFLSLQGRTRQYETRDLMADIEPFLSSAPITIWDIEILREASSGCEVWAEDEYCPEESFIKAGIWMFDSEKGAGAADERISRQYNVPLGSMVLMVLIYPVMQKDTKKRGFSSMTIYVNYSDRSQQSLLVRFAPDLVSDHKQGIHWAYVEAASRFLELPFVTKIPLRGNRAEQRRIEKKYRHVPEVNTVVLRRQKSLAPYPVTAAAGNLSCVDWQCQWMVRGHWRKQWYPKAGDHKPVWVEPYLKGPEDKPLRASRESVFMAKR